MAKAKCKACGWQGQWSEVGYKTVYEDWGDVMCCVCPSCRRVEYEGMDMLEDIGTTYWLDWGSAISTEYTCYSVDELLEWANNEFKDVLNGEVLTEDNCSIKEVL